MDELASQPASPASVQEEDYQEVDPPSPQEIIQKAQRPKPMHSFPRPTQFDRPPVARSSQSGKTFSIIHILYELIILILY
jgi:hypothetical protein